MEKKPKQFTLKTALFAVAVVAAVGSLFTTRAHNIDIAGAIVLTALALCMAWLKYSASH